MSDVDAGHRPVVWCFVSRQLSRHLFTAPALVDLEVAATLKAQGWIVVGPDPQGMHDLAVYDRAQTWLQRLR